MYMYMIIINVIKYLNIFVYGGIHGKKTVKQ